jgi:ATP-dependent Clp protease protease subunit
MKFFAKAGKSKAELYLYDAIGNDYMGSGITAESVKKALAEMDPKAELQVFVNSPGGSVFEGLAIYNQLKRWGGRKKIYVDGIAASIASIIAMAGDEIHMASNGMMMIHEPWGLTAGTAEDMRKYADSLDKVSDTLLDTYVVRTAGDRKKIKEWMSAETWMSADDAIERGFATSKTEEKAIKAEFPMLAKFTNVPAAIRQQALSIDSRLARMQMSVNRMTSRASPARA